ncbi:MAG TPA: sulfite exporter TauE/SafE family protein [Candidatus Sulfotelmatobacter sp.]|nr:sulfite exporter TauE/SafE family protein [Candidatus Sulfotelmatobacter sp.]
MPRRMMQLYLPIAELSVNVLLVFGLGLVVGILSGMFGIGGGFLLTPALIFIGVPPVVAVSSQAPQILAASVSGGLAHWRRDNIDVKLGLLMVAGGLAGSLGGVWLFSFLRQLGQINLVISLTYVLLLGVVGSLMLSESLRTMLSKSGPVRRKLHRHTWLHRMPLRMRFRKSRLYISVLPPLGIGLFAGVLVAIMGVGGGFITIPAMIFLLGMPTMLAVGTSLFQIIFVTVTVTLLQAVTNATVDIPLALLLTVGGVVGAQFGAGWGQKLRAEQLRGLLALLVLAVAVKVAHDLVVVPPDLYSVASPVTD